MPLNGIRPDLIQLPSEPRTSGPLSTVLAGRLPPDRRTVSLKKQNEACGNCLGIHAQTTSLSCPDQSPEDRIMGAWIGSRIKVPNIIRCMHSHSVDAWREGQVASCLSWSRFYYHIRIIETARDMMEAQEPSGDVKRRQGVERVETFERMENQGGKKGDATKGQDRNQSKNEVHLAHAVQPYGLVMRRRRRYCAQFHLRHELCL
jgi:hypothetical protein